MSLSITQKFKPLLKHQGVNKLYRKRPIVFSAQQTKMQINGLEVVNFSSNDYLGLANNSEIKKSIQHNLDELSVGSGASHLISGHNLQHHLLEDELADWLVCERVLLFPTGYMANIAVLESLMFRGDIIVSDKLNHASLVDGSKNSLAKVKRYPHLDTKSIERRLEKTNSYQQVMVVTDGVFSMDGDIAPLGEIQKLCQKHNSWLYVDDAHGLGMLGDRGLGTFSYARAKLNNNTILMGTFGKAFGTYGAFVAGSETLIETLIQFARPYIYTTAMSPLNAIATRTSLKIVQNSEDLRQKLRENILLFKTLCKQLGLGLISSDTAIQSIVLKDNDLALKWSEQLKQQGFWVVAIRPPTVPKNTARLRITISASHTTNQINSLILALENMAYNKSFYNVIA